MRRSLRTGPRMPQGRPQPWYPTAGLQAIFVAPTPSATHTWPWIMNNKVNVSSKARRVVLLTHACEPRDPYVLSDVPCACTSPGGRTDGRLVHTCMSSTAAI